MRILYLHQHFATPEGSTGTRSYEFARRWVKQGHDVTLVCGNYDLNGLPSPRGVVTRHDIEGFEVFVLGTPYSNKQSSIRRITSFLLFMLLSTAYVLTCRRPDVIFATSTPLTIAVPALVARLIRRVPFVFEVRDQWPAVPIAMGVLRNPLIRKLAESLERAAYGHAASVIALSPGMAAGIRDVAGENVRITVAPNSSDTDSFRPAFDKESAKRKLNLPDGTVVVHFGAVSIANDVGFLLDVASDLRSENVTFLIVGGGQQLTALMKRAADESLSNCRFLGPRSKTALPSILEAADVSAVLFAPIPILEHNSANKFFDSLAAGLPVLLNYDGWQGSLVRAHEIGYATAMGDRGAFSTNLLRLHRDPVARSTMGSNARRLAEQQFERDRISTMVLTSLVAASEDHNH